MLSYIRMVPLGRELVSGIAFVVCQCIKFLFLTRNSPTEGPMLSPCLVKGAFVILPNKQGLHVLNFANKDDPNNPFTWSYYMHLLFI